jgi:tetratricopeptide (TPR) repeat protein
MEPLELAVHRGADGAEIEVYDAPTLFEEGGQHLDADRFAEGAKSYERIAESFPDSPYVPPALFNAGLCYEGLGRFTDAADRYRRVAEAHAGSKVVKDALLRWGSVSAELSRWPVSIEIFDRALKRDDLNLSERVEAMSRRALASFEIGDLQVADAGFRDALSYYQQHKEEERIESTFFVAMAQFYEAHIAHRRFREMPLRLPQKQLEQDVQALARQFATAQERYVETIRWKNPMWASAAGFHAGALYRELYDALIKAPLPAEINDEFKKLVYGTSLKGNLRTLLEKARGVLEKNVEMGGRVGVKNGWIEKSSEQLEEISKLLYALDDQQIGPDAQTPPGERQPAPPPPRSRPEAPARPKALL